MKKLIIFLLTVIMTLGACVGCKGNPTNEPNKPIVNTVEPDLMVASKTIQCKVGDTVKLNYLVKGTEETVSFESANGEIATVDSAGVITGVAVGDTTITLKLGDYDEENIVVSVSAAPTYRLWSSSQEVLLLENATFALEVAVKKGLEIITEIEIAYHSLDEQVVTVSDEGVITAVGIGETSIQVSCVYAGKTLCEFIPVKVNGSIYIKVDDKYSVNLGETKTFSYSIENQDKQTIQGAVATIISDDESKVSVSGNQIKGNCVGATSVTLTYEGATVTVPVDCVYKPNKTEYNQFRDDYALKDVIVTRPDKFGESDYTMSRKILQEDISGNVDKKLYATNPEFLKSYMFGFYIPPMLSKTEIMALKGEGYKSLELKICVDMMANNTQLYISSYVVTGDNAGYGIAGSYSRSSINGSLKQKTWYIWNIDIDAIIDNYTILKDKKQPLFTCWVGNVSALKSPYKFYLAPLSFVKAEPNKANSKFIETAN